MSGAIQSAQTMAPVPAPGSMRDEPRPVALTVLALASLTIMANATIAPSLPGLTAAFADVPNIATIAGLALSLPSLSIVATAALFG